jgi:hypothetical protein
MAKMKKNLLYIGAGFAVAIVFIIISETSDDSSTAPSEVAEEQRDPSLGARGACREFVRRVLNDPDSAQWEPGTSWERAELDDGKWIVYPELRARNSFNALIRTRFECIVEPRDGNWYLVSLEEQS